MRGAGWAEVLGVVVPAWLNKDAALIDNLDYVHNERYWSIELRDWRRGEITVSVRRKQKRKSKQK